MNGPCRRSGERGAAAPLVAPLTVRSLLRCLLLPCVLVLCLELLPGWLLLCWLGAAGVPPAMTVTGCLLAVGGSTQAG